MVESELSLEFIETFAANVREAMRTGRIPPEGLERMVFVLADMLTTLARSYRVQRELNAQLEESAEALPLILNHLGATKSKKIGEA